MPSQAEARAALQRLIDQYHSLTQERRNAVTEADVVTQYIEPLLFDVLGWPKDERHFFKELRTASGRPDITLKAEGHEAIYIEAKTFGVIKVLQEARSKTRAVLLPEDTGPSGVAYERSPEELQAVNYAFREQSEWAILTNFEHFRLFNARYDRLVLAVEQPALLAEEDVFDLLWLLAYPNVLNGSLEQLRTVHHAPEVDTKYLQFINEWREKLAQDLLERPAANRWLFRPDGSIDLPALREVVQRYLDRLVLVRFAEDHLVIKAGTLWSYYENRRSDPYTFTLDQYIDRLMRSFNELHNSALFAPHLADEANFSDGALLELIPRLYEARYRSMPADILGNTYEQYLGKRLAIEGGRVTTHDNLETRKKQGSYYTPQVIVRHLVDTTLGRFLYGTRDGQPNGAPVPGETRQTADSIRDLRVLDAACGSGSFLIYAYEVLARFYKSETMRLEEERDARGRELEAQGYVGTFRYAQLMPFEEALQRIRDYPRLILETHLYGVDLDPQAAELAVVNLIMRAMERAAASMDKRLPLLLNQNIKIGNGLVGLLPNDPRLDPHRPAIAEIARLRAELRHTSHGLAHEATQAALETATADLRAALDSEFAAAFDDGERVRPFHWGIEFPEVFCDETGAPLPDGGFTVIFGNPPWEIVMPEIREFYAQFDADIESKLNRQQVEARIEELNAEDPSLKAQWEAVKRSLEQSAVFFRQSPDYTRQGRGHTATHKLFIERMWRLLKHGGRLGYVVPSGIYTDLGTKDLRQMLLFSEGSLDYLYSFSNERGFFNGVHHDFKFCLLAAHKGGTEDSFEAAFRFNPRVAIAPEGFAAFVADPANRITVERESIRRFSPDSLSLMEFKTRRDYQIAEGIYDRRDVDFSPHFAQELNLTTDSDLFNTSGQGVPIYEGKMIHQFDAYFAAPSYWVNEEQAAKRVLGKTGDTYTRPRLAYRDVTNPTNERTVIAAILPPYSMAGHTTIVEKDVYGAEMLALCAIFNSFCFDWMARFRAIKHLTFAVMCDLPVPRLTAGNSYFDAIVPRAARLVCTRPEFAGLWESVMGTASPPTSPLVPLSVHGEGMTGTSPSLRAERGSGLSGGSGGEVDRERQRLRDEIDGLVAHLYGLSREDYAHILASFPLVFPDTDAGHIRMAAVLAAYDAAG